MSAAEDLVAQGLAAYAARDFATAQACWEQAATAGSAAARDCLQLVAEGDARRQVLWGRMAERDNAGALWNLGVAAVERADLAAVRDLWSRAAAIDPGCADQVAGLLRCPPEVAPAMLRETDAATLAFALGEIVHGTGQIETARLLWALAAEAGSAAALYNLGAMAAAEGREDEALDLLRRAREQGDTDAQALLERLGVD